ncbi:NB-ARC domain, LRR domain containing protein [Parasponia andersonii]|uniref:NB-ARC domain, LRR domain containing protein n=1 Tax=Parasponia andersonii TaxID=3476 RepID=A0A2P5BYN9_PARAD|nr:NB-ARC domain, LRR domain containing protein [Parasponia andersonii]
MADLAFIIAGNVVEKLGSLALEEITLPRSTKDDVQKLKEIMSSLKGVLPDAEKKLEHDEHLRIWLRRLGDVLHDAEDILDEFEGEVLRSQVVKEHGTFGSKVHRFFSHSNSLAFRFSFAPQIRKIRQKLDEIAKEGTKFQLYSSQLCQDQSNDHLRQGTTQITRSFEVIGRESDKETIIDMLMKQDNNSRHVTVIPIVGQGGLGKSTLANLIYNDERVVAQFGFRLFITCMPLDFEVTKVIVSEILKCAIDAVYNENFSKDQSLEKVEDFSNWSIEQVLLFLRITLYNKKCLFILDDVCDNRSKWIELRDLLSQVGSEGSKIIVTTDNTSVASMIGTTAPYKLENLSEDDSFLIFLKCAFGDEKLAEQFPELRDIGRQIVKKCKGIPLAVKIIGSSLYSKTDESEWVFVRDNEIWGLEGEHSHTSRALRLSYTTMPSYLKPCFAYCSLFPKGDRLHSLGLICTWMALGILQSPNSTQRMEFEKIGELHFKDLCVRSFFQHVDGTEEFYAVTHFCEMHDLIRDLALSISQHECSTVNSSLNTVSESARYLTVYLNDGRGQSILTMLQKSKNLRSMHLRYHELDEKPNIDESFLSTCISRFKYLRVFDLSSIFCEVLPSSIGTLRHLRYLNLFGNKKIKKLPSSICKLQSLQTLILAQCNELEELPRNIRNLVSLRTLWLTTKQTCLPENGVGRLCSLRFLIIGQCQNLKSLPHDLRYCTTLRNLIVGDCKQLELASRPSTEVVQNSTLQTLAIDGLPKTTALPNWLQGAAETLQVVEFENCPKLATLPGWMPMPNLTSLVIKNCPALPCLPQGILQRLTSLTKLKIEECEALEERFKLEVGED